MSHTILFILAAVMVLPAVAWAVEPVATPVPEGVRMEAVVYKKTPQGELSMQLYYPAGWKAEDKRPAAVFFFGGAWAQGTIRQFDPQAKYLSSRGMVAACADYRVASRHKTTPVECVQDAKSAVRYIRANAARLGVDPNHIAAGGGSAGGHIAACTAMIQGLDEPAEDGERKLSSRPNLLLLYNPVLDLTGAGIAERAGSAEKAKAISPHQHLAKGAPPAILYYGSQDRFVEHGRAYLKRAAELGVEAELYVAEGAGHGFFNRPPWLDQTTFLTDQFLARHGYLKGEPTLKLPEGKVSLKKEPPAGKE